MGAGLESRRRNAQALIRGGCTVTPGTDSYEKLALLNVLGADAFPPG